MNGLTTSIISILSIIIALITIFTVVYKKGKQDQQVKDLCDANLPTRLTKMEAKQDVLWEVFQEQVLRMRPDLATHGSGFTLSESAKKVVEQVRFCFGKEDMVESKHVSDHVLFEIPHRIGMEKLKQLAEDNKMTLGELLAILTVDGDMPRTER